MMNAAALRNRNSLLAFASRAKEILTSRGVHFESRMSGLCWWAAWRHGADLVQVGVKPWSYPGTWRCYVNLPSHIDARPSKAALLRLGLKPDYRWPLWEGNRPWAEHDSEVTCLDCELEQLASLAIALAEDGSFQRATVDPVWAALFPGRAASYCWTRGASAHWDLRQWRYKHWAWQFNPTGWPDEKRKAV